ncbi:MAG: LacI family transcriptional regulator [Chitinophagaceae bacterium]|jgi:DNA-binding LacI/PurR family transcriptional regulator|nr:LacI family transcriptional regulator [Chitinophagaceae bacterium]
MNHITIKDIAKILNVSVSTVSRALNDKYDVKKETREIILAKAKELGFTPNPIAQKLISRKSKTIGVVVPEFINSFFPEVISGIQNILFEKNYQVVIMSSEEKVEREKENLLTLKKSMVDGLIISLTCETTHIDTIRNLIEEGMPVVLFNRISNNDLPAPKVVFNDYKWAYRATEHLIETGKKDIVHLCGPRHLSFAANRIKGFTDALLQHQLPLNEGSIIDTGLLLNDGYSAAEMLIKTNRLPEAIFAVNDPAAIGAIRCLLQNGIKVPEDVAVVGFTECPFADLITPSLTSVLQPAREMGEMTATIMLELLGGKLQNLANTYVLEGKLNPRKSSERLEIR